MTEPEGSPQPQPSGCATVTVVLLGMVLLLPGLCFALMTFRPVMTSIGNLLAVLVGTKPVNPQFWATLASTGWIFALSVVFVALGIWVIARAGR